MIMTIGHSAQEILLQYCSSHSLLLLRVTPLLNGAKPTRLYLLLPCGSFTTVYPLLLLLFSYVLRYRRRGTKEPKGTVLVAIDRKTSKPFHNIHIYRDNQVTPSQYYSEDVLKVDLTVCSFFYFE